MLSIVNVTDIKDTDTWLTKETVKTINPLNKQNNMNAKELIEALQEFDGDLPVMIMDRSYYDPEECARSIDNENMEQRTGQDGDGNPVDMIMIHINQEPIPTPPTKPVTDEEIEKEVLERYPSVCLDWDNGGAFDKRQGFRDCDKWMRDKAITQPAPSNKEEVEQQLLNRWGFSKDGAVDTRNQLKIFSFMDWFNRTALPREGVSECNHNWKTNGIRPDQRVCNKCNKLEYQ